MHQKHSHCSYCGTAFGEQQPWPRTCAHCGNISYVNPLPVVVMLVPTEAGLVLIRRGIEPAKGKWALPGGFINLDETWQQAGAREVHEETGIRIVPEGIADFWVCSAPDGTLLVFGVAERLSLETLPPFQPNEEALEQCVVLTPPENMAFALHREAMGRYFAGKRG